MIRTGCRQEEPDKEEEEWHPQWWCARIRPENEGEQRGGHTQVATMATNTVSYRAIGRRDSVVELIANAQITQ